jgi:hypothetical protein
MPVKVKRPRRKKSEAELAADFLTKAQSPTPEVPMVPAARKRSARKKRGGGRKK